MMQCAREVFDKYFLDCRLLFFVSSVCKVDINFGEILYLHQNALGYKYYTFCIDFDPFRMILTFISVANA